MQLADNVIYFMQRREIMNEKQKELMARLEEVKQKLIDKLGQQSGHTLALSLVEKYRPMGSILWRIQAAAAMCVLRPGMRLADAKSMISEMSI